MRQILERAVDWSDLAHNPAGKRLVKPPKATPADVNPFQSWKEVKKVAAKAGDYRSGSTPSVSNMCHARFQSNLAAIGKAPVSRPLIHGR
jgi:hypothetical protein